MERKRVNQPFTTPAASSAPASPARQHAIGEGLQKLFDDVVNEPVPDDLLKILEDADKRRSKK